MERGESGERVGARDEVGSQLGESQAGRERDGCLVSSLSPDWAAPPDAHPVLNDLQMLDGPPPPAYTASEPYPLPTLSTLPFPVLTLVIHHIVRSPRSALDRAEVQQWMLREARLTSRMLYAGE